MSILLIAWITIKRNFRNYQELLLMLLLPIGLIFILGNALEGMYQSDPPRDISVAYEAREQAGTTSNSVEDGEEVLGEILIEDYILRKPLEEYLAGLEEEDIFHVQEVTCHEEGRSLVEKGKVAAFLSVETSGGGKNFLEEGEAYLRIITDNSDQVNSLVVKNIMESFVQGANASRAAIQLTNGGFLEEMASEGDSWDEADNEDNTYREIFAGMAEEQILEERSPLKGEEMPGAMDYYAVTMLVMTLMYGSFYSAMGLKDDYLSPLGSRIASSPVRFRDYFAGKNLGNVLTVFLQGIILLVFTRYVYGVYWGENLAAILLVIFSVALLATGLGAMVMMFSRNEGFTNALLQVVVIASTFISGGYIIIARPGELLQLLQHLSPNYLAHTAIFNTIYQGPPEYTAWYLAGIWLLVGVTFLLSLVAERRNRL